MKGKYVTAVFCICACLASGELFAQTPENTTTIESRIVSVSLFKNGLGFVLSEAYMTEEAEKIILEQLPAPVHGTFWIYPLGEGIAIRDARAFEKESVESLPAVSVAEILEANTGNTVILHMPEQTVIGRIISVAETRSPDVPPGIRPDSASLVLVRTESGMLALNKNRVQKVGVIDGELNEKIDRTKTSSVMEISLAEAGKGKIGLQYLTKGITWAPSCSVDITDTEKAIVLTKAEIINEIGDLENVTVNFVSGFPNFQFSEIVSPMAMQGTLAGFLNSLARPQSRPMADVMMQRVGFEGAGARNVYGYTADPEGTAVEDLFFYERKNVTLGKGQRGYYPLYKMEVPYEHIYQWDIGDFIDAHERYRTDIQVNEEEVWHSLKLKNTGKIPWTTAPAMITQSGQVLGQSTLNYTSSGAHSELRITRAVDIRAEQEEFEISRERNAANFHGTRYDLVEVRGVLNATNFKNTNITLTVTKTLSGEVTSSIPEATIEKIAHGLRRVNPRCRLTWEIPMEAGEKIQVEYRYNVYVRN